MPRTGTAVGLTVSEDKEKGAALGNEDSGSERMLVGTKDGDRDSEDTALGTDDGSSVGMLVGTKDGDRDSEDTACLLYTSPSPRD